MSDLKEIGPLIKSLYNCSKLAALFQVIGDVLRIRQILTNLIGYCFPLQSMGMSQELRIPFLSTETL